MHERHLPAQTFAPKRRAKGPTFCYARLVTLLPVSIMLIIPATSSVALPVRHGRPRPLTRRLLVHLFLDLEPASSQGFLEIRHHFQGFAPREAPLGQCVHDLTLSKNLPLGLTNQPAGAVTFIGTHTVLATGHLTGEKSPPVRLSSTTGGRHQHRKGLATRIGNAVPAMNSHRRS